MPRGQATPKPVDTQYYLLDEPEDLLDVLKDSLPLGWQGAIMGHVEPDGSEVWGLQLNHPLHGTVSVGPGEVVLVNGGELSTIPEDQFHDRFEPEDPKDAELRANRFAKSEAK